MQQSSTLKFGLQLQATNLKDDQVQRKRFNISELPEMIFVETRFIKAPTMIIQPGEEPIMEELVATKTAPVSVTTTRTLTPPVSVSVSMSDAGTLTDAPNPQRDRSQQTDSEANSSVDVSVQCNLEQDEDNAYFESLMETVATDSTSTTATLKENNKQQFLQFASEKTQVHSNGKQECLVCGEIKATRTSIHAHMALHWGPAVLCWRCGVSFEHRVLLKQHLCHAKRKQAKPTRRLLKCPHFRCPVTAISCLELYDHINEHSAEHCYRCLGCSRVFLTAGELRHHIPLRLKCIEMAKRQHSPYQRRLLSKADAAYRARVLVIVSTQKKHVLVKSFLSQHTSAAAARRCSICMQRCSNTFKFSRHWKRCLKDFHRRLARKRQSIPAENRPALQNGFGHY